MDTPRANVVKTIRTSVMIPEDLNEELRALARAGDRKFSDEIRRALRNHVQRAHSQVSA